MAALLLIQVLVPQVQSEGVDPKALLQRIKEISEAEQHGWKLERMAILDSTLVMRWSNGQNWVHAGVFLCKDLKSAKKTFAERESQFESVNKESNRIPRSERSLPGDTNLFWIGGFASPKVFGLIRTSSTVIEVDAHNPAVLDQFANLIEKVVREMNQSNPVLKR